MTKRHFKGFTLIELTVGTAILSVVAALVIGIWLSGLQNYNSLNFAQARDSSFFEAFNRIDAHVRVAKAFPTTYTDSSTGTVYNANSTTLIMSLNAITQPGGSLCDYTDYVIISYNGTTLTEKIIADPNSARRSSTQTLAKDISSTSMIQTKNAGEHRTVEVTVTSQKTVNSRQLTSTHTQIMTARND